MRHHFPEIDSTNAYALSWADAPPFSVVSADFQSAGRGRLGREWVSPRGRGLYFSVVNPVGNLPRELAAIGSGVAVVRALKNVCGVSAACKWPNDVLLHGQKIGGILCEARGEVFVVGVGLNLSHTREELPQRPLFPAASLAILGVENRDGEAILAEIAAQMRAVFALETASALALYREALWGVGEVGKIGDVIGVVDGVDERGALKLRTSSGAQTVLNGDLKFF